MKRSVCHISYNHHPFDDRIYWKELLTLQEAGYETVHLCVGDENKDFISQEGIRIIQVKRVVSANNIWLMRIKHILFGKNKTIKALFLKAKELQAAIYHYHDLQINALTKDLKKLAHRPKIIYDVHEMYWLLVKNDDETSILKKTYLKIYSAVIKYWELRQAAYCDYIILTDWFGYEHFKKYRTEVLKTIIYNYSFFDLQASCTNIKVYDFIYAGHISKARGIEEIIHAIAVLRAEMPELKCLIIGAGDGNEYIGKLKRLIVSLGANKNVLLHEAVPFKEIKGYYQQSKIGLGLYHPTKKYSNAIAIKLFEYMAFGLPVIFANHGPSAEIILKENCGLLVDVSQKETIVDAMVQLLTNNILYEKSRQNGIKAVEKSYNWKIEKINLLKVYDDLLKN